MDASESVDGSHSSARSHSSEAEMAIMTCRMERTERTTERLERTMEEWKERLKHLESMKIATPNLANQDTEQFEDEEELSLITSDLKPACSTNAERQDISDEESEQVKLAEDSFSFLVTTKPGSIPFCMALLIVTVKNTIFGMALVDLHNSDPDEKRFAIPVLVSRPVLVSQFFAICISVFTQDDLLAALTLLFRGYNQEIKLAFPQGGSFSQWLLTVILSFTDAAMGLTVAFVLAITSSTVLAVMLNFLAMSFVFGLDDAAFRLSKLKIFGKINANAAEAVTERSFKSPKLKAKTLLSRTGIMILTLAILLAVWIFIITQQTSGRYVTQTLYVQFSDDVIQEIAAHSGFYEIDSDHTTFESGFLYKETRDGNGRIGYCSKSKPYHWSFFLEGEDPCQNVMVESHSTESFDILDSAETDWYVYGLSRNGLEESVKSPMKDFYIAEGCDSDQACGRYGGRCESNRCSCASEVHGVRCSYQTVDVCPMLKLDERFETAFASSRSVSSTFNLYDSGKSTCYDRPIFFNSQTKDVLFFMGIRWAISNTNLVFGESNEYGSPSAVLARLSSPDFHASEVVFVDFVSEQVPFQNGGDIISSPVGLSWLFVTPAVDFNVPQQRLGSFVEILDPVKFLCGKCNNSTNPCYHEGFCDWDGVCACQDRVVGSLCQVIPTGDGRCDPFFNKPLFGFDGGDCCMQTCNDSPENTCGILEPDEVNVVYLGFKSCIDPTLIVSKEACEYYTQEEACEQEDACTVPIMQIDPQTPSENYADSSPRSIPVISADGKYMAVRDKNYFEVFKLVGSKWLQFGTTVRVSVNPVACATTFGSIAITSGVGNIALQQNATVVVAISSVGGEVYLYRYSYEKNDWVFLIRYPEILSWDKQFGTTITLGSLSIGSNQGNSVSILLTTFQFDENFRQSNHTYSLRTITLDDFFDDECLDVDAGGCDYEQCEYEDLLHLDGEDCLVDVSGDGNVFLKYSQTDYTWELTVGTIGWMDFGKNWWLESNEPEHEYAFFPQDNQFKSYPLIIEVKGEVLGIKLSHFGHWITIVTSLPVSNTTRISYFRYSGLREGTAYAESISEHEILSFGDIHGLRFSAGGKSLALCSIQDKQSFKKQNSGQMICQAFSMNLNGAWKNREFFLNCNPVDSEYPSFSISDNGEIMGYSTFDVAKAHPYESQIVGLQRMCEHNEYTFHLSMYDTGNRDEMMYQTKWSFVPVVFSPLFGRFVVDGNPPKNVSFSCSNCYNSHSGGFSVFVEDFCVPHTLAACGRFFIFMLGLSYYDVANDGGIIDTRSEGAGFAAYLINEANVTLIGTKGWKTATYNWLDMMDEIIFSRDPLNGSICPVIEGPDCKDGKSIFSIMVPLDHLPRKISWELHSVTGVNGKELLKTRNYTEALVGQPVVDHMCLSPQSCHEFVLWSDHGTDFGNYTAFLGSQLLFTDMIGYGSKIHRFGFGKCQYF